MFFCSADELIKINAVAPVAVALKPTGEYSAVLEGVLAVLVLLCDPTKSTDADQSDQLKQHLLQQLNHPDLKICEKLKEIIRLGHDKADCLEQVTHANEIIQIVYTDAFVSQSEGVDR